MPEKVQAEIRVLTRWLKVAVVVGLVVTLAASGLTVALYRSASATVAIMCKTEQLCTRVNDLADEVRANRDWDESKKKALDSRVGRLEAEIGRLKRELK